MLGTTIGFYQITKQLGQGGMGAVYLAEHTRIGSRKVIKVLLPEFCQNAQVIQRFENEARASARLDHRNIIKVDDFGQLPGGQWYILMPFLDGGSLETFLGSHGKLSIHQALPILAQICAALQAAHDAGIVHRDLKPANVFLTQTEDNPRLVTLLDFGIAKLGDGVEGLATQTGAAFGTPAYMPAEQFEDASRADARSDLFALGVIAYQMVTGCLPFGMVPGPVLYNKQITTRPERPKGVPFEWAELLLRALSLRPVDRPASARAFALALAAVTPEDPPFEPDGMRLVATVARELLTHAPPDAATVRNPFPDERAMPTGAGISPARQPWPAAATSPKAPVDEVGQMLDAARASGNVGAPLGATTLSAMQGHQRAGDVGTRKRAWLAAAGAATLAIVVAGATHLRGDQEPTTANIRPAPTGASTATEAPSPQRPRLAPSKPAANPDITTAVPPEAPPAASTAVVAASPDELALTVETEPAGAALQVDGRAIGRAPQVVTVRADHDTLLRAELPGRVPLEKSVRPSPDSPKIMLRLERVRRPARTPTTKTSPGRPATSPRPFDPDAPGGDS